MSPLVQWSRLLRFKDASGRTLVGEPVDPDLDVGLASFAGSAFTANVYNCTSILDLGAKPTGEVVEVKTVLCPLEAAEVGSIRCIGLNYKKHAIEAGLPLPKVPVLFLKPATALNGPYPDPILIGKGWQDDQADYETELSVVIGRTARDVTEAEAMDYILGYACSNDVSARLHQGSVHSQWCYGKGMDKSAPLGPVVVSTRAIPDPSVLHMSGIKDGVVVQDIGLDDLIFDIPKLVSYLSQGTTLPAGTVIMTGTPGGIGFFAKPQNLLRQGDEFRVHITGGLGTLINKVIYE